jgi:hypothetical protein
MDGGRLARLRWRLRGAWLWPTFVAITILDAVIGHMLPPVGDSQRFVAALLLGLVLNVIAVLLLSRPLGALVRHARPELPIVVARDYAGTGAVLGVAAVLLLAGLAHRPSRLASERDLQDAIARAQAWIGDRAPAEFRRNLDVISTYAIDTGIYRACVISDTHARTYCVIVRTNLPFARSVRFDGYEPNAVFAAGAS